VLYSFCGGSCTDTSIKNVFGPEGGLTFDAAGNLYGTTSGGLGAVFELPAESGPAVSSNPPTAPPSTPAPTTPSSPTAASSSTPATTGTDALTANWQSTTYPGQTFHFKLDGDSIDVYSGQLQLGALEAMMKGSTTDIYQGPVRMAPVTQCPGGQGLMQIKAWNDNQLDAKIETPVRSSAGITCGGILGSGKMIPWEKVTFVKQ
jgi:hypothetical protein